MTPFGVVDMTNKKCASCSLFFLSHFGCGLQRLARSYRLSRRSTGDVPGDTSFVVDRRTTAYQCRTNPQSMQCSGGGMAQFQVRNQLRRSASVPPSASPRACGSLIMRCAAVALCARCVQGDVPNCTDLVLKWDIEVDGNWGPYQYCNPLNNSDQTGEWACVNELSFSHGGSNRRGR
jgi:hypothetical protein